VFVFDMHEYYGKFINVHNEAQNVKLKFHGFQEAQLKYKAVNNSDIVTFAF
jgi:hypothetical protein